MTNDAKREKIDEYVVEYGCTILIVYLSDTNCAKLVEKPCTVLVEPECREILYFGFWIVLSDPIQSTRLDSVG